MRKPTMWFPTRSDTNRPVQSQKRARGLKFWNLVEEELYYSSSENEGADQLRSYCKADLRLCFRRCRLLVFPCGGSYVFRLSAKTAYPKVHGRAYFVLRDVLLLNRQTLQYEPKKNLKYKTARSPRF